MSLIGCGLNSNHIISSCTVESRRVAAYPYSSNILHRHSGRCMRGDENRFPGGYMPGRPAACPDQVSFSPSSSPPVLHVCSIHESAVPGKPEKHEKRRCSCLRTYQTERAGAILPCGRISPILALICSGAYNEVTKTEGKEDGRMRKAIATGIPAAQIHKYGLAFRGKEYLILMA